MKKFKVSYAGEIDVFAEVNADSAEEAAVKHFLSKPKNKTLFVEYGLFKEEAFNIPTLVKKHPELKQFEQEYEIEESEEIDEEDEQSAISGAKYFFLYTTYGKKLAATIVLIIGYFIYEAYKN